MNRRSFMQFLGLATVATPALSKTKEYWEASAAEEVTLAPIQPILGAGKIREIFSYDIQFDAYVARWDILIGNDQVHVDMMNDGTKLDIWLDAQLPVVRELLGNEVLHRGLSWKAVKAPPMPIGSSLPRISGYRARYV